MNLKAIMLGLAASGLLLTAACNSGTGTTPDSTASSNTAATTGSGSGSGASGRDGCLTGTWKVDVDDMAKQAAAKLPQQGVSGKGTGAITLSFGDKMTINYQSANLAITAPISAGTTMTIDATYSGSAVSTDWTAKDGKLAGTMPTNTVKADMKATVGGKVVDMPSTPFQGALDLSQGNLAYTCSGSSATLVGPGVTWKLTKA